MKNKYSQAIITGSIAFDEIMDFPGAFVEHFHPEKLHQINVSFVVNRLEKQFGGIATNIAYNTRLVSKEKVSLFSAVGKDGGDFISFFQKMGINTDSLYQDNSLFTATGKVITDKKDNQIWGYYYGALCVYKHMSIDTAPKNTLLIVAATHKDAFIHIQRQAIKKSIDYIYDPGMALTWITTEELKEGIDGCKYLVGNDYEIAQMLRRLNISIVDLLKKNITVITTLGAQGVQYADKTEEYVVPAYTISKIVDPTGAGDAWRGGFVAGLLEGKSIRDSLALGNALASFAVENYGTINHKPSQKEVHERFIKITN